MLFSQVANEPAAPWRDELALLADILGIAAFVMSLSGFLIGLWINRRITKIKNDSKRWIEELGRKLFQQELGDAKNSLTTAKELCLAASWVRAEVHLEGAIERLSRQLQQIQKDSPERRILLNGIDDVRIVLDAIRIQPRQKAGKMDSARLKLLDSLIKNIIEVEAKFRHDVWEMKL